MTLVSRGASLLARVWSRAAILSKNPEISPLRVMIIGVLMLPPEIPAETWKDGRISLKPRIWPPSKLSWKKRFLAKIWMMSKVARRMSTARAPTSRISSPRSRLPTQP
jgi:hypothetical protein